MILGIRVGDWNLEIEIQNYDFDQGLVLEIGLELGDQNFGLGLWSMIGIYYLKLWTGIWIEMVIRIEIR